MTYLFIKTMVFLLSFLPWRVGEFAGRWLGIAASFVPAQRFDISRRNIRRALAVDEHEARRINRDVLCHFGRMVFEVPHILRLTPRNLSSYVSFENQENLLRAVEKGKGVFILTGHFGNWELMSAAVSMTYRNCAIVVRPVDFKPLNRVIRELRTRFDAEIIPKNRGMRRIIQVLDRKRMVGILLDQNVDWPDGVFVKFLGEWACTNKGLALLALKTGAPVVPVFSVRGEDGRYRIVFEKEIPLIRTGSKNADLEENTILFTRVIESYILRYPDHWFWFHRRWKTRPYCSLAGQARMSVPEPRAPEI